MLNTIWKDRNILLNTKLRIFNSNVKSVFIFGFGTWIKTASCIKRLQTLVNGCLRKILRIPLHGQRGWEMKSGKARDIYQSWMKFVEDVGDGLVTHSIDMIKILYDRYWDGALKGKGEGEGHERHGEEVVNWRWKQLVTLGVTSLRWLGIKMEDVCPWSISC